MELFTNQILAGIASGAIYACMALAVVMIYLAAREPESGGVRREVVHHAIIVPCRRVRWARVQPPDYVGDDPTPELGAP